MYPDSSEYYGCIASVGQKIIFCPTWQYSHNTLWYTVIRSVISGHFADATWMSESPRHKDLQERNLVLVISMSTLISKR